MSAALRPLTLAEFLEWERSDRRVKAAEYTGLNSVMASIMLEQDRPVATMLRRSAGWREEVVAGPDAILQLPELRLELTMAQLYR